ncbi:MAG: hypothetical protein OEY01_07665 [Desulfobulbaceae bacterium]|nr:hypothetical protein [Desulfobulbaceae bacterium]HIJ78932.1 hypothetical protein [Deltaproteobacteria bacterium]
MCIDVRKTCECGAQNVQFHLRDNIMRPEVISRLFCPACPGDEPYDGTTMVNDNGWVVEYDMVLARMLAASNLAIDPEELQAVFLFDQGYAAWLEMYPGEREEIMEEKAAIMALAKEDQQKYLQAIQRWNIERVEKLKAAGWRKAKLA